MSDPILYIPEPLEGVELAIWFRPLPKELNYTTHLPLNFFETVTRAANVEEAQAIVLPNNFKINSSDIDAYLRKWADEGERLHIPVYAFSLGDFTDGTRFDPRVQIFRHSTYRSTIQSQDIVLPTLTEDRGREGIVVRMKRPVPRVAFCGMGGFSSPRTRLSYVLKNIRYSLESLVYPVALARRLGVYWRRAAMHACERSPLVQTDFIIRRSFSGSRTTIELDPEQARREFLDNIIGADFVLAPKGDGNYSNRLLETLSLGRIPVLIDTDTVLPFEEEIDYAKILVRVPISL